MEVSNVLLQKINITADKPFGIYDAQNVQVVDSRIVTPGGVNRLDFTNATVSFR
jgi:polygalacturonase